MGREQEVYDDQYYLNLPTDSGRIRSLLRLIDFGTDDTVCEIGCAAGHFLVEASPFIKRGIGLDVAETAIRAAQRTKDARQVTNVDFEEVSASEFARRDENAARFEYVLLLDVTEHIADDMLLDVLDAAKRLLKADGRLVIHTPNLAYWLETLKDRGIMKQLPGHIAVRDEPHYRLLLREAGFGSPRILGLPHYRQPLRLIDTVMSRVPLLGRLFRSRLFVVVTLPESEEQD